MCGLSGEKLAVGPGCFFTTEITMSAQRAQWGCGCSVGVQEFWGSFAHIAVSFVVLVVKNWPLGRDVFLPQRSPCRRKGHSGDVEMDRSGRIKSARQMALG